MKRFDAVIFDMDGTLVDSEVVWDRAETELFAIRGIDYNETIRQQVIGLRLDEFFERLIAMLNLSASVPELVAELDQRMLALIPTQVQAKPYANDLIHYVAQQQIPYCIASSSPMSIINAVVNAQGWDTLISLRFTADSVARGKPAPDVYLYAAEQLGVNPANCLALEDSPNGARAAVAAGMTCYAIPDFHSKPEAFYGITPHVFNTLADVLRVLQDEAAS